MPSAVLAVIALAAGAAAAVVGVHLAAQASVARAMRRRDAACPFEDDDHQPLPVLTGMRLAIEESLRLLGAYLGTLRRLPPRGGAGTPVALLVATPLPRSVMRRLASRLATSGRPSVVLRTPRRWDERSAARLASALERARDGAPVLDALAFGRGAPFVMRLLGTPLGASVGVRAVLAVGGRLANVAAPPGVELLSIYSLDDVWLQPPDAGYHPGAGNVALRGEGHFGLLQSARATAIVCENLLAFDEPLARPGSAA
jgi:hypothetical protein